MNIKFHLQTTRFGTDDSTIDDGNTAAPDPADLQHQSGALVTPAMVGASLPMSQALYLTEPGDTAAISGNDIHQGQIGDCFLLSSFGEEALFHPAAIANMIHSNADGSESVTLYLDKTGQTPNFNTVSFRSIVVTVNNRFSPAAVNNGAAQDVVGNRKEIWPQVLEKAVAVLDGGYGAINSGGNPALAMEELTGQVAAFLSPASLSLTMLQSDIALGDLIVMDTSFRSGLPYGLVSNHAYMFDRLTGGPGSAMVQLLNPWGTAEPSAIPLTQLARSGIVEIDVGHVA